MTRVIDSYDAALFDLDGVVYLGPIAVVGAADGIQQLRDNGIRIGFVTNNAARTPAVVADHLVELGIPAGPEDVVTSAQAGASLVLQRFGRGARVLPVGGRGVQAALDELGLVCVDGVDDRPVAVMQGYGTELTWHELNEAAIAIQRGAHWVATNIDPTRPTDRGLVPGNGAAVAAVRQAVEVDPEIAGKPYRPLVDATVQRLGAERPIFVGDRLDTDIAGAVIAGLDSMLVLSGSHGPAELVSASPTQRPTHLGRDLRDLLQPPRILAAGAADRISCGDQTAVWNGSEIGLETQIVDPKDGLDALWAVANLAWRQQDLGNSATASSQVIATISRSLAAVG